MPCSNAAKTRNPLKFAGVPQTIGSVSAASGLKYTILWGHLEDIFLLNKFFFRSSIRALIAKISPDKVVRWCPDGDFWQLFYSSRNARIASAVLATAIPSVCLSVCLSATRVKTTARSTVQFAPLDSKMCQKIFPRDDPFPLKFWLKVTYTLLKAASFDTFCLVALQP